MASQHVIRCLSNDSYYYHSQTPTCYPETPLLSNLYSPPPSFISGQAPMRLPFQLPWVVFPSTSCSENAAALSEIPWFVFLFSWPTLTHHSSVSKEFLSLDHFFLWYSHLGYGLYFESNNHSKQTMLSFYVSVLFQMRMQSASSKSIYTKMGKQMLWQGCVQTSQENVKWAPHSAFKEQR